MKHRVARIVNRFRLLLVVTRTSPATMGSFHSATRGSLIPPREPIANFALSGQEKSAGDYTQYGGYTQSISMASIVRV